MDKNKFTPSSSKLHTIARKSTLGRRGRLSFTLNTSHLETISENENSPRKLKFRASISNSDFNDSVAPVDVNDSTLGWNLSCSVMENTVVDDKTVIEQEEEVCATEVAVQTSIQESPTSTLIETTPPHVLRMRLNIKNQFFKELKNDLSELNEITKEEYNALSIHEANTISENFSLKDQLENVRDTVKILNDQLLAKEKEIEETKEALTIVREQARCSDQKVASLKHALENLCVQGKQKDDEVEDLKELLSSVEKQVESSSNQITLTQTAIAVAEKEAESHRQEVKHFKSSLCHSQMEGDSSAKEILKLKADLLVSENSVKAHQNEVTFLKESLAAMEETAKKRQEEVLNLMESLHKSQAIAKSCQEEFELKKASLRNSEEQVELLQKELEEIRKELNTAQKEIDSANNQDSYYSLVVESNEGDDISDKSFLDTTVSTNKDDSKVLGLCDTSVLQEEVNKMNAKKNSIQLHIKNLESQIANAKCDLDVSKQETLIHESETKKLEMILESTQLASKMQEDKIAEFKKSIEMSQVEIKNSEKQVDELKIALNNAMLQVEMHKGEIVRLNNCQKNSEELVKLHESIIAQLKEDLLVSKEQSNSYELQAKELHAALELSKEAAKEYDLKIERLRTALEASQEKVKSHENDVESMKQSVVWAEMQSETYRTKIDEMFSLLEASKDEVKSREDEIGAIKLALQGAEEGSVKSNVKFCELQENLENAYARIKLKEDEISAIKESLNSERNERDFEAKAFKHLIDKNEQESSIVRSEMQVALEAAQQELFSFKNGVLTKSTLLQSTLTDALGAVDSVFQTLNPLFTYINKLEDQVKNLTSRLENQSDLEEHLRNLITSKEQQLKCALMSVKKHDDDDIITTENVLQNKHLDDYIHKLEKQMESQSDLIEHLRNIIHSKNEQLAKVSNSLMSFKSAMPEESFIDLSSILEQSMQEAETDLNFSYNCCDHLQMVNQHKEELEFFVEQRNYFFQELQRHFVVGPDNKFENYDDVLAFIINNATDLYDLTDHLRNRIQSKDDQLFAASNKCKELIGMLNQEYQKDNELILTLKDEISVLEKKLVERTEFEEHLKNVIQSKNEQLQKISSLKQKSVSEQNELSLQINSLITERSQLCNKLHEFVSPTVDLNNANLETIIDEILKQILYYKEMEQDHETAISSLETEIRSVKEENMNFKCINEGLEDNLQSMNAQLLDITSLNEFLKNEKVEILASLKKYMLLLNPSFDFSKDIVIELEHILGDKIDLEEHLRNVIDSKEDQLCKCNEAINHLNTLVKSLSEENKLIALSYEEKLEKSNFDLKLLSDEKASNIRGLQKLLAFSNDSEDLSFETLLNKLELLMKEAFNSRESLLEISSNGASCALSHGREQLCLKQKNTELNHFLSLGDENILTEFSEIECSSEIHELPQQEFQSNLSFPASDIGNQLELPENSHSPLKNSNCSLTNDTDFLHEKISCLEKSIDMDTVNIDVDTGYPFNETSIQPVVHQTEEYLISEHQSCKSSSTPVDLIKSNQCSLDNINFEDNLQILDQLKIDVVYNGNQFREIFKESQSRELLLSKERDELKSYAHDLENKLSNVEAKLAEDSCVIESLRNKLVYLEDIHNQDKIDVSITNESRNECTKKINELMENLKVVNKTYDDKCDLVEHLRNKIQSIEERFYAASEVNLSKLNCLSQNNEKLLKDLNDLKESALLEQSELKEKLFNVELAWKREKDYSCIKLSEILLKYSSRSKSTSSFEEIVVSVCQTVEHFAELTEHLKNVINSKEDKLLLFSTELSNTKIKLVDFLHDISNETCTTNDVDSLLLKAYESVLKIKTDYEHERDTVLEMNKLLTFNLDELNKKIDERDTCINHHAMKVEALERENIILNENIEDLRSSLETANLSLNKLKLDLADTRKYSNKMYDKYEIGMGILLDENDNLRSDLRRKEFMNNRYSRQISMLEKEKIALNDILDSETKHTEHLYETVNWLKNELCSQLELFNSCFRNLQNNLNSSLDLDSSMCFDNSLSVSQYNQSQIKEGLSISEDSFHIHEIISELKDRLFEVTNAYDRAVSCLDSLPENDAQFNNDSVLQNIQTVAVSPLEFGTCVLNHFTDFTNRCFLIIEDLCKKFSSNTNLDEKILEDISSFINSDEDNLSEFLDIVEDLRITLSASNCDVSEISNPLNIEFVTCPIDNLYDIINKIEDDQCEISKLFNYGMELIEFVKFQDNIEVSGFVLSSAETVNTVVHQFNELLNDGSLLNMEILNRFHQDLSDVNENNQAILDKYRLIWESVISEPVQFSNECSDLKKAILPVDESVVDSFKFMDSESFMFHVENYLNAIEKIENENLEISKTFELGMKFLQSLSVMDCKTFDGISNSLKQKFPFINSPPSVETNSYDDSALLGFKTHLTIEDTVNYDEPSVSEVTTYFPYHGNVTGAFDPFGNKTISKDESEQSRVNLFLSKCNNSRTGSLNNSVNQFYDAEDANESDMFKNCFPSDDILDEFCTFVNHRGYSFLNYSKGPQEILNFMKDTLEKINKIILASQPIFGEPISDIEQIFNKFFVKFDYLQHGFSTLLADVQYLKSNKNSLLLSLNSLSNLVETSLKSLLENHNSSQEYFIKKTEELKKSLFIERNNLENSTSEISSLKQQLLVLEQSIVDLTSSQKSCTQQNNELISKLSATEVKLNTFEEENNALKQQLLDDKELTGRLEANINCLTNQIEKSRADKLNLERELSEALSEKSSLVDQMRAQQDEFNLLKSELSVIKSAKSNNPSDEFLQLEFDTLNEKLLGVLSERDQLQCSLDKEISRIKSLEANHELLQKNHDKLMQSYFQLLENKNSQSSELLAEKVSEKLSVILHLLECDSYVDADSGLDEYFNKIESRIKLLLELKATLLSSHCGDEVNDLKLKVKELKKDNDEFYVFKSKFVQELLSLKPDKSFEELVKLSLTSLHEAMLAEIMSKEEMIVLSLKEDYENTITKYAETISQLRGEEIKRQEWVKEVERDNNDIITECEKLREEAAQLRQELESKFSCEKLIEEELSNLERKLQQNSDDSAPEAASTLSKVNLPSNETNLEKNQLSDKLLSKIRQVRKNIVYGDSTFVYISDYENVMKQLKDAQNSLETQCNELQEAKDAADKELALLSSAHKNIQDEYMCTKDKLNALEKAHGHVEQELLTTKDNLKSLNALYGSVTKELHDAKSGLSMMESNCSHLKEELVRIKKIQEEKSNEYGNKITKLERELMGEKESGANEKALFMKEKMDLISNKKQLSMELKEARVLLDNAVSDLLKSQRESAKENELHKTELSHLRLVVSNLEFQSSQAKLQLDSLKDVQQECIALKEEIAKLKVEFKNVNSNYETISLENHQLKRVQNEYITIQKEVVKLNEQLKRLNYDYELILQENNKLKHFQEDCITKDKEIIKLNEQLKAINSDYKIVSMESNQLKKAQKETVIKEKEIAILKDQLQTCNSDYESVLVENKQLKTEINAKLQEIEKIRTEVNKNRELEEELCEVKERCQQLDEECDEYCSALNDKENTLKEVLMELKEAEENSSKLLEELNKTKIRLDELVSQNNAATDSLKIELETRLKEESLRASALKETNILQQEAITKLNQRIDYLKKTLVDTELREALLQRQVDECVVKDCSRCQNAAAKVDELEVLLKNRDIKIAELLARLESRSSPNVVTQKTLETYKTKVSQLTDENLKLKKSISDTPAPIRDVLNPVDLNAHATQDHNVVLLQQKIHKLEKEKFILKKLCEKRKSTIDQLEKQLKSGGD